MKHIIAVCSNLTDQNEPKGLFCHETCKKYPGSGFLPYLLEYGEKEGFLVYSGKEVIDHIHGKQIDLKEDKIYVIQEENNNYGVSLRTYYGADSAVVFCLESPLYAPIFYDKVEYFKEMFRYQFLFGDVGNRNVYFPTFDLKDLERPVKPWEGRDHLCAVISNKHFSQLGTLFKDSPTWRKALQYELHTDRLQFFQAAKMNGWDIFGRGWPAPTGIKEIPAGEKLDVIENYQYCFCYENCEWPGYVTEKFIECLIAGTIPIYHPPENHFLPPVFFDWKSSSGIAHTYMERGKEVYEDIVRFRKNKWLRSFSYQDFAQELLDCVISAKELCLSAQS